MSQEQIRPISPRNLLLALRPRERLLSHGPTSLSQGELLAVVLGPESRAEALHRLARRLLRRYGLEGLAELPASAWRSEQGLGDASAARLCAVFELGRRTYAVDGEGERPRLSRPQQAYRKVRHLARARKEHLVGLYLDAQNGLLHQETISIGSLNTTRTHPREILYPAVKHLALGFILAHNHPSGCLDPSPEDLEFTHAVRRGAEFMGIELYDHLIVGRDGYTSMRERGLL